LPFIQKIWDRISHSGNVLYPAFSIPPDHIVGNQFSKIGFGANKAYFELRICEQFLRDKREYWNEYNPLTLVLCESIYAGARQSFPFIVGPGLLKGLEQLEGNERVYFHNTRVFGPTPYRGDDVAIFVGLFRVKTCDWARQALSLLESFAKVFDTSKLTNYLNFSGPIMDGIESFLDMDDMQFRLGQRDAFTDPETHVGNVFSPGYFVIIRADEKTIKKDQFWVKRNQLHIGDTASQLRPYRDQDYILYQVSHLDKRNDYSTFDFNRQWRDVQNDILKGNKDSALSGLQNLNSQIIRSPDLISSQMNQLLLMYQAKYEEALAIYSTRFNPTISIANLVASTYGKSFEHMASINVDEGAFEAITKSRDYFLEEARTRPPISGPIHLKEDDIQRALNSKILNDPSVKSIEPNKLAAALPLAPMTPF
jgi:hypothetical protein